MYDKRLVEDIDRMTFARVHLWDKLYCDERCGKDFAEILTNCFGETIEQDTATGSYTFKSEEKVDLISVTEKVKECILKSIEKMHINNDITNDEYEDFKELKDNLFAITIQIAETVYIKI